MIIQGSLLYRVFQHIHDPNLKPQDFTTAKKHVYLQDMEVQK